jgi:hypothetical protein
MGIRAVIVELRTCEHVALLDFEARVSASWISQAPMAIKNRIRGSLARHLSMNP